MTQILIRPEDIDTKNKDSEFIYRKFEDKIK